MAALSGLLLLGFAVLFGVTSWQSEKDDQIRQMLTVLEISEKALDRHLLQHQASMDELVMDIGAAGGLANLPAAQRLLRRFHDLHPEAAVVTLIRPDGLVLASSLTERLTDQPNLSADPIFQEFLKAQTPTTHVDLSRPLLGMVSGKWVFPMRMTLRDAGNQPIAFLSLSMPVELVQTLWQQAPVVEKASLGLIRDDGYLLSRYPVPNQPDQRSVYKSKQSDALAAYLAEHRFPARGYVEGANPLDDDAQWANAFMRLEHFPATFFVSMPVSAFRSAWWERVQGPYLLIVLFSALGFFGYRYSHNRQHAWEMERRETLQRLRESEQEERFLIEGISAGIVIYGPDGKVQRCNRQALRTLGVTEDDTIGSNIVKSNWRVLREDGTDLPPAQYLMARVMKTHRALFDVVLGIVKPGSNDPIWLLCNVDPELNDAGTLRRTVMSFVDITARKNAERMTELSESRYRMLYENSLEAVLQLKTNGDVLHANPAACTMFRSTERELQTRRGGLADRSDLRFDVIRTQLDRHGRAQGELTMLRDDGSRFEAEISATVYVDLSGRTQCSAVMRDVTDRRRVDAALAAQELAERANRAKSQFVARMSHELRTPLNAILGFSDVLLIDPNRPLDATQREDMQHIHDAGQHLLSMIDDLLDLSQVEAGALKLSLSNVDPIELVQQAVREMRSQAESAGIALSIDAPPNAAGRIRVDRTRFKQVVLNLVSNAIKYNRPRGRVSVSVAAEPDRLVLTVADSGLGMSAEQIDALYQPFNRLGRESTVIEGTGIGMAITKNLIEVMGGELNVTSEVDVGTEFRVDLPLVPADAEAGDSSTIALFPATDTKDTLALRQSGPPRAVKDLRVLLAEDNAVNQDLGASLLRMVGLPFDMAPDGRTAVDMVRRGRYDLVLMDMQMPEMDGLEATRALRAIPAFAKLPIIAMTANAFPGDRAACLTAGMNDHIGKPVRPRHLYKVLSRWLGVDLQPPPPQPPLSAPTGLHLVAGLDSARGLAMFGGQNDTYRLAIEHYLALYAGGLPALDAHLDNVAVDLAALRREVHGLGGASAAIGALGLEARAKTVDMMLGSVDRPPGAVDAASTRQALDALRTELTTFIGRLRSAMRA